MHAHNALEVINIKYAYKLYPYIVIVLRLSELSITISDIRTNFDIRNVPCGYRI